STSPARRRSLLGISGAPMAARTWTQKLVTACQSEVRAELVQIQESKGVHARLQAALRAIADLDADDTGQGRLRRYVYVMSALVHHERHGGLTPAQINRLVDLGYAILQAQGVVLGSKHLGSLYGDLHLIKSQILRLEGASWPAAWEQEMAF